MRLAKTAPRSIHSADCTIWETPPDARPDVLIAAGINEDEIVRYCGEARPVYDAFKRVLGQLSGVLLLAQTGADDPEWRESILEAAREQIEAARDRLTAIRPTSPVERHYDALVRLGAQLDTLYVGIRCQGRLVGAEGERDRLISELFSVHRGLLAAAEPRAGMTPVDFSHACCSGGRRGEASSRCTARHDKNRHIRRSVPWPSIRSTCSNIPSSATTTRAVSSTGRIIRAM